MFSRLFSSFSAQLAGLALSIFERLVVVGLLIRIWGVDLYSDWAAITAMVALTGVAECGLQVYFGNCMQEAYAAEDETRFQRIVGLSIFSYGVIALAMIVMVPVLVLLINPVRALSLLVLNEKAALAPIAIMLCWSISNISRASVTQIYRGRGDFGRTVLMGLWARIAIALATVVLVLLRHGVFELSIVYFAVDMVVGWGGLLFDLRRRVPHLHLRWVYPTRAEFVAIFEHARWYTLSTVAPILWNSVPVLLIGQIGLSGEALVSFVAARTLVNFVRQTATLAGLSVGVELAHTRNTATPDVQARAVTGLGTLITSVTAAALVGVMIFAPGILRLWTGNTRLFEPVTLVALLMPAICLGPVIPLANMLTFANAPRAPALANVAQICGGFVLGLVLAWRWGVPGLAVGLAAGEIIAQWGVLLWLGRHAFGIRLEPYLRRCVSVGVIAAAWSAVVGLICATVAPQMTLWGLLFGTAFWASAAIGPTLLFSIPQSQRNQLLQLVGRLAGRIGVFRA